MQVLLTILLISCTASLTVRATQLSKWFGESPYDSTGIYYRSHYSSIIDENKLNAILVIAALVSWCINQRLGTFFAYSWSICLSVNKLKPFLRVQSDQPSFYFFPKSGATDDFKLVREQACAMGKLSRLAKIPELTQYTISLLKLVTKAESHLVEVSCCYAYNLLYHCLV